MLHAYIDESEHKTRYFCLSALMITEENLVLMELELKQLLFEYAITTPVSIYSELHGYDMMQQKKD
ncbi:MAG TPA: hypothetical protein K8U83_04350 [Corynebacterium stationis]|nr:hypothetical protein [Corynebacterium stationis]HJG63998.1 hypothetical protein [Corynebacterium stationis]